MIDQVQPGSAGTIQDCEDVKNQRLQGILRYWNEMRGERAMPSLRQIDPIEIPKLLPIVLIADVAPAATKMRLLGTDATNAYGRETRGTDIKDLALGDFSPLWLKAFALVRETGRPVSAFGAFRSGLELLDVETLLTPLSDDGEAITHIFGGLLIRPAPCMAIAGPRSLLGGISSATAGCARQAT
jgi:hypothetical protein